MSEIGSKDRPLRVGIIGSGPSGFYAAEALLRAEVSARVDIFDRLPTPYGLVRAGVAPDHPKLKKVIRVYEKVSQAEDFSFLGNVTVGKDISVAELRELYDALVFTCGTETDRHLDIPGIDLPGSHTATEFVGWYNAHPDFRDRVFDLSGDVAVVVGQGNVAMDVSRILAKTPDELCKTDIADYALEQLAESKIREIHLVGRRGPVQAKFTPPEIREIGELQDCDPVLAPGDLDIDPASRLELEDSANKIGRENFAILEEFAARRAPAKRRRYVIRFLEGPIELRGQSRVERLVVSKNRLEGEASHLSARDTGEREEIPCNLFFRSIGYHGIAIPGLPFDEHGGVLPNVKGRIVEGNRPLPGLYCAGWIKRGPSGVIGTNKPDARETIDQLLADLGSIRPCATPDTGKLLELLRSREVDVVNFDDWRRIDSAEIERGKPAGKPREKFSRVAEMLSLLRGP